MTDLEKIHNAETAMARMTEFQGPAIVEFILEGAANVAALLTLQLRSPCSVEL